MLIYIAYALLFLNLIRYNTIDNIRDSVLKTTLLFATFIVFITELLSLFKSLNLISLKFGWFLSGLLLLFCLVFKNRKETGQILIRRARNITNAFKALFFYEKLILFLVSICVLLLFYQGFVYPPNNWDSLTYHMSRILFWIGNESVDHFPTHILRHLYQPPFTEYFILNLNLLTGNDLFSNSVQLQFLVLTLFSIYSILSYYNVSRFYKILALLFAITIPSVQLQASTTKNDIVCAFFVITALYFCIKTYHNSSYQNFIFLGLSVGLAMLTKGTAYIYLAPVLLLFAVFILYKLLKSKDLNLFAKSLFCVLLAILLNVGHFTRNYAIDHNILNIDKAEGKMYSNDAMDSHLFLSNFLKNVGLHCGYPVTEEADQYIKDVHYEFEIFIDSPLTNYFSMPYHGAEDSTHEDLVSNTAHLFLIAIASALIVLFGFIRFRKNSLILLFLLVIILQITLFVSYLKWQPWHTRLHIPIFLLSTCLIFLAINVFKWFKWVVLLYTPIILFSFGFYFVYNSLRPMVSNADFTKAIQLHDNRYKKYFSNRLEVYPEYEKISALLKNSTAKKIGLMLNDWEYPLFTDSYGTKKELRAINVTNITNKIIQNTDNISIIISNKDKQEYIMYQGRKYSNQTRDNNFIWLYKLQ